MSVFKRNLIRFRKLDFAKGDSDEMTVNVLMSMSYRRGA